LGGLGSWVAWGLVSAGIGTIVGVDGDKVEESNFNRQILYSWADVGRLKAEAAGEALRRFRPELTYVGVPRYVAGVQDARELIRDADLVVATIDQPSHLAEHWVQEACFAAGKPVIALTQHPPLVRVGPLYVPGSTGCLECQESEWRRTWASLAAIQEARQVRSPSSTYGPACGVVGTLAAGEVVAAITGLYEPATLGAEQIVDLSSMTVERRSVPRLAGCRRCAGP
jgi:bacteriocin biosynthesis cyclodehydratase domain-containing protein